nr:integrase, catalytic region, zinc finger, CCHC-type, peptidase aspartic, catalytic [Tanacetum cinerariifolium]
MVLEKKVNIIPINYTEVNRLSEDFGKRFVPRQELPDEQDFWLQTSHLNTDQYAFSFVKIEAPSELLKDKNNRETHIYYLKHTMKQAAILREIVPQAKLLNPLDRASYSTCKSKSTDNTKNDKILKISSKTHKKNKVEDHSRIVKSCLNKPNCVVEPSRNAHVQHSKLNTNSELECIKYNSSMFDARHELCFFEFVPDMNASFNSKSVKKAKNKKNGNLQEKRFTKIGYNWRPTRRTFTLDGNVCPLTRIITTNKVPLREPIPLEVVAQESVVTKVYTRRPKVVQIVLWYLDFGCSKHMTRDRSQLTNFVHKFLDTVKFDNNRIAKIMGYGDYQIGNITIEKLYLLHMDFCGPMRVASINGKKYILFIMDDYSQFTWVKFLASKDEAPDFNIKFLKMIQVRLNMAVRNIRTENGTEFSINSA